MNMNQYQKKIIINEVSDKLVLKKNERKLNVAAVDQNFLKREEEIFTAAQGQQIFLLKKKIGAMQRRAVIDVYIGSLGMNINSEQFTIRTSSTDSTKSELYIDNSVWEFDEGEQVRIVY